MASLPRPSSRLFPSSEDERPVSLISISPTISRALAWADGAADEDPAKRHSRQVSREVDEESVIESIRTPTVASGSHDEDPLECISAEERNLAPDGGIRAWLVVLGGFINFVMAFGVTNSFGSFQSLYTHSILNEYPVSVVAWVGGVQLFLVFASGLVIGPAYDRFGSRWLMFGGAALYLTSFVCTSYATAYYQILLSQGFLFGIRNAMMYFPATGAIAEWFDEKRGFALGLAISGSSIGGILWPLVIEKTNQDMGFGWTNRVVLLTCIIPLAISCMLVKECVKPSTVVTADHSFLSPRGILKEIWHLDFVLLCLGEVFIVSGMIVPFNWISLYAVSQGASEDMANHLYALCYAGSTVGRIFSGWLADRFGRFNVLLVLAASASTLIFAWLKVHSYTGHMAWVVLYGLFSGGLIPLASACVAQTTRDMSRIGLRIGVMMTVCSPGTLVACPLSGVLLEGYGWAGVHVFAASMVMVGTVLTLVVRVVFLGRCVIA